MGADHPWDNQGPPLVESGEALRTEIFLEERLTVDQRCPPPPPPPTAEQPRPPPKGSP